MTFRDNIWQALRSVNYPGYTRDIVSFGLVDRISEQDGELIVTLAVGHLDAETQRAIVDAIQPALEAVPGDRTVRLEMSTPNASPQPQQRHAQAGALRSPSIEHVIAVGSGKGGVGKSTVAVNVAVALARQGLRVGLMDADVYGPNVPRMLGVTELPPPQNGAIAPAEILDLRLVSIGLMVETDKPLVWRGPMTDKLVRQFLTDVAWGDLDLLVVDLPPGTGDIALSLAKYAQPDGAIVVATPQEVALDDARKAVGMFRSLDVPVLGLVENMSFFRCPDCGSKHDLFGSGGGYRLAEQVGIPMLGEIPLEPAVRRGGDEGQPAVLRDESHAGRVLREIAAHVRSAVVQNTS